MNIAESARFNALKAQVEKLEREVESLKQIVEILTSDKTRETLRIKKSA